MFTYCIKPLCDNIDHLRHSRILNYITSISFRTMALLVTKPPPEFTKYVSYFSQSLKVQAMGLCRLYWCSGNKNQWGYMRQPWDSHPVVCLHYSVNSINTHCIKNVWYSETIVLFDVAKYYVNNAHDCLFNYTKLHLLHWWHCHGYCLLW